MDRHDHVLSWGSYVDSYRADGSLAERRVFNRDGSRIDTEYKRPGSPEDWDERHTVVLSDGTKVTFENSGNVQRTYDGEGHLLSATEWTEDGPRPLPTGQLAFARDLPPLSWCRSARQPPSAPQCRRRLAFTWLSSRKDPNHTAVFAFKAKKYRKA